MIICLQFCWKKKPGFPSSDLLILNNQLTQTGVARYVDIDQAARNRTTKMIAASGAA